MQKRVEHLVVDTNAFINSAPIQDVGENVYTIQEVIDEVTSKRQLRHLSVLNYNLIIKYVFVENIKFVTEFSKKTGDYLSLSATDIKVIALTYQLEKEKVGTSHLNEEPKVQRIVTNKPPNLDGQKVAAGFFQPTNDDDDDDETEDKAPSDVANDEELDALNTTLEKLNVDDSVCDKILVPIGKEEDSFTDEKNNENLSEEDTEESDDDDDDDDDDNDDSGWITVSNISQVKKELNADLLDDTHSPVACITADFAMQNVLKQIGLKVATYDGRLIKRVQTFILRCTTCFKTTSVMSKVFCPNCGHNTLKKVGVTLDENGKYKIHINSRKPLTARGKRFSLPAPKGGAHAVNPILTEDQPRARQRPTRLARTKNNPLDPDYVAGYSPFIMRDVNSKSAVLGIRNSTDIKNWMRKNPNEVRKKRK